MATVTYNLIIHVLLATLAISVLQVNTLNMLEPFSTLYLHTRFGNALGNPIYEYGTDAIEDAAYDPDNNVVYTAGDGFIHVIDVTGMNNLTLLYSSSVESDTPFVALCGSFVTFLAKSTGPSYNDGRLFIYKRYNRTRKGVFERINIITVGPEPESIAFTEGCRILVVANTAGPEPNPSGTDIVDPEGSVSILEFAGGDLSKEPTSNTKVTFTKFNDRWEEYVKRGVRFVYRGQISSGSSPTLFSQDLTPEYVVLNNQGTKAYVCLQENNAIAVIDIASRSVDEIYALGAKSWSNLDMDVSDKDGIMFGRWNIRTLYQPDEIRYFESGGSGYILTANEGDTFDIEYRGTDTNWTDVKQGGQFTDAELSTSLDANVRNALKDNGKLKYFEFSTIDGLDESGKIKELHGFGGRGISVYRVSDFQQVYDSGDTLAKLHADVYPNVFNADDEPADQSPEQLKDLRSTKQGVDCESIAFGEINGVRLVFVGADRVGTIMVFRLGDSFKPKLEYVFRNGSTNRPIRALFNDRDLNDAAPEALTFIPANQHTAGSFPMLMVAGTESGTLSFYRINYSGSGGVSSRQATKHITFLTCLVVLAKYFLLYK